MKITKLKIKGYKNLDIDIEHHSDIMIFIGLNGSGKSNVLEAICYIFKEMYNNKEINYMEIAKKIPFEFELVFFSNNGATINITNISSQNIKLIGEITDYAKYNESSEGFLFPSKLIAIYSGEEKRLWTKFFKSSFDEYIMQLSTETILKTQHMIFLSRKHWDISLLTLLISELQDAKDFVTNVLKIMSVNKIKFEFNKQRYKSWKANSTFTFVKSIDFKNEYSLTEVKGILSNFNEIEIFSHLYNAILSEMIIDIQITFNDGLTLNDLSEGEKKLLLLKAAFEFVAQEDSLFLLDEPDSHIHLNNKPQIVNIINQYKHNRQFILTTHSPTLTQCIKDIDNDNQDRIYVLDRGKNVDSIRAKEIDYLAGDFWSAQQQTAFLSTKKDVILLVEGKHDKVHILNAWKHYKGEYPDLDFDIFVMNGADNVTHMITGLRKSDNVDKTKKYIGILDNDESGRNCRKESDIKYPENKKIAASGFMTILYPVPDGFTLKDRNKENDYTVENLLPISKYEDAYKNIVSNYVFTAQKIDNISKEIQEAVKGLLASRSRDFNKTDFKEFKKLFDILQEIVNLNTTPPNNAQASTPPQAPSTQINSNVSSSSLSSVANTQIDIFADYAPRGQNRVHYVATFDKVTKKVIYNGNTYLTANQAMVFIRKSANNGKDVSGVQAGIFWKYLNASGEEQQLKTLPEFIINSN